MQFIFHALADCIQNLQRFCIMNTKLLNEGFLKNCLILSFKKTKKQKQKFGRYQHLVKKYSVGWSTDTCYRQLNFVSKPTIVSLLCLTMALHNV